MIIAVAAFASAACGARSGLREDDAQASADVTFPDAADTSDFDASVPDALMRDVASDLANVEETSPVPCVWRTGELTWLTAFAYDESASAPFPTIGGALVPYTNDNDPSPDPAWYVQPVDAFGQPSGDRHAIFSHAGSYSGLSIGGADDRRAAIAWDEEHGCRFVALDERGTAVGAERRIGDRLCRGLRATRHGYALIESEAADVRLHTLTVDGETLVTTADLTGGDLPLWMSSVVLDDDTFGLIWMPGGVSGTALRYRHFDTSGNALAPVAEIATFDAPAATPRVIQFGNHLFVAWQRAHDAADSTREVWTQELALDGAPLRDATRVPRAAPLAGRNELVVRAFRDDILVAYIVGSDTTEWSAEIQVLTAAGTPRVPALEVSGSRFVLDLGLSPTSAGVVLSMVTEGPPGPDQVADVPLLCDEP